MIVHVYMRVISVIDIANDSSSFSEAVSCQDSDNRVAAIQES